jgi:TPR repeat protein
MKTKLWVLMLLAAIHGAAIAGYDEGLAAALKGDFTTAVKEWQPLANAGDAKAQTDRHGSCI